MTDVRIEEKKVWVGGTAIPLLSGEVHYWRLDPNSWRDILQPVKEMGIKTVATYACWDFHQTASGQFDFTGETDPRRNLIGFLELLTEEGFWIIFRPGPYIYSEWKNNGAPDEAARYHRLHPEFLRLAESYMEAITEATRPYLASHGGNIILWQSDNEIDPWSHLYTEAIGLGQQVGLFHEFLEEHYQTVDALNAAWCTQYLRFEQARAVSEMIPDNPQLMGRYNNFRAFIHWYVNRVARWGVDVYRRLGVDVPIILNAYSGVATQRWADLEAIGDLVGSDIYPSSEFRLRHREQRHVLEAVRYSRTFSKAPYIAEFEAGIWHEWLQDVGTFTPNHYRLICLSALQAGVAGWNWYMLVNRDNWYQCPINEWGRKRPDLFDAFKQITTLYNDLDPSTLNKITHTAVTFDPLQRSTSRPGQDLLHSFHTADIDYEFVDLDGKQTDKDIVFYAGGQWLSQQGQQHLVDYVNKGGHLVFVGEIPTRDEHMNPLNLLNLPQPSGIISALGKANLELFDGHSIESAWWHLYDDVEGDPISVNRLPYRHQPSEELMLQFSLQEGLTYTVGYRVQRGTGYITVIGLESSAELLLALHQHFNVTTSLRSIVPDVTSALFERDGEFYVIATNDGTETKAVTFDTASIVDGQWLLHNFMNNQTTQVDLSTGQLTMIIPAKDGVILRLQQNQ